MTHVTRKSWFYLNKDLHVKCCFVRRKSYIWCSFLRRYRM